MNRKTANYTCLSHMWGPREEIDSMRRIVLNDKLFRVRENLAEFLNMARTRYAAKGRKFWIDAICIDQTHMAERNEQVAKMGDMYRNMPVVAWLGKDDPGDSEESWDPWEHDELQVDTDMKSEQRDLMTALRHLLRILIGIGHNPYWQRAWIVQEQHLAREVVLLSRSTEHRLVEMKQMISECWDMFDELPHVGYAFRLPGSRSAVSRMLINPFLKADGSHTDVEYFLRIKSISGSLLGLAKAHKNVHCED